MLYSNGKNKYKFIEYETTRYYKTIIRFRKELQSYKKTLTIKVNR